MIKRLSLLLLISVVALMSVISCGYDMAGAELLHKAERELRADRPESARDILDSIKVSSLDEECYQWKRLLDIQTSFKLYEPVLADSTISECVDYWHRSDNRSHETLALCYRAMIRHMDGNLEDAAIDLKHAESMALSLDDLYLKNRVFGALTALNYASGNLDMALSYARRELEVGKIAQNNDWMSYAYNHFACIYARKQDTDSMMFYIKSVIPLLDRLPADARAPHYSNVGVYYLSLGDSAKALEYAWKSYEARPIAPNTNLLARIYFGRGDSLKANTFWREGAEIGKLEENIRITETKAREYYSRGMYREAGEANMQLLALKDSSYRAVNTARLQQLQLDYDHAERLRRSDTLSRRLSAGIVCVVLSCILAVWLLSRRHLRSSRDVSMRVQDYERRINDLEASHRHYDKAISSLRSRMRAEIDRERETMARGKALYEGILAGTETTVRWSKRQYDEMLAYYRMANPALYEEMERDYRKLSPGNKLLIILSDMDLGNEEIARVLGISVGSLRSARSRLRAKRINQD